MAKEKKVKKEETNEIFEEKVDKKSLRAKIVNITMWVILLTWMAICTVDFILVQLERETIFTFSNQKIEYDDGGYVLQRTGLGYRAMYYNCTDYRGLDFGPFWLKNQCDLAPEDRR